MPQKPSLLSLYGNLPKKNCNECGFPTCMAFAAAILEGKVRLVDCPYISEEEKTRIESLIAAPVAKLVFGKRKPLAIGDARVMHRHELKFYNPTAIAVELSDSYSETGLETAIKKALDVKVERQGETYSIDAFAIRSDSGNAQAYAEATSEIINTTDHPLILNCWDPTILEAGLEACDDEIPLIFAATKETLESYVELAKDHNAPLVVANEDLGQIRLMAKRASDRGLKVALYPITMSLQEALKSYITIRRGAIENKIQEFGHPLIGVPASLTGKIDYSKELWWRESLLASALVFRYSDALIIKRAEIETLLPVITLRQGVFSDPKVPAKVKPGLHRCGSPDRSSPVLLTVNYALTYYLVTADIDKAGIHCHLLVVDTGGMSVLNALAGGQLKPETVSEAIKQTGLESTVSHKKLIIPGLAARLRREIEDLSGWEVLAGPVESRDIPLFLKK